jgi:hypothetical protein
MKEFKFDHANKSWDRYKWFHNINSGIVEFEGGELMVASNLQSYNRHMYDDYGIQIVSTTEKDCPQLYFDKECTEPVIKAWLTQEGQQEIAIDWEQRCAVAIRYFNFYRSELIRGNVYLGSHVKSAGAYWAGAERMPVPLSKIKVQRPNPEYKKKVQPVLNDEVVPAITAMWRLSEASKGYTYTDRYKAKEEWLESSASEIIDDICNIESDYTRKNAIQQIAQSGFRLPRATTEVDFLYVKGEQEDLFSNQKGGK